MCSRKCDIPVVPGTSLRPPTWYQTQSETTGACRASSACMTSPLSRRREAGASVTAGGGKKEEGGGAGRGFGPGTGWGGGGAPISPHPPGGGGGVRVVSEGGVPAHG